MCNVFAASRNLLVLTFVILLAFMLAACQSDDGTIKFHSDGSHLSAESSSHSTSLPVSAIYVAPNSVQDLVNRADVAFTGTISGISDPIAEKPFDWKPEDDAAAVQNGSPLPRMWVTYYKISLEEIFLDDGNLQNHPILSLLSYWSDVRPSLGKRYLFVLGSQPDGKSYGIDADWSLIPLDGGGIRNYDGTSTGYIGVTDESSLLASVEEAAAKWEHLPNSQWPVHEYWLSNEDAVSGNALPAPGDGDDSNTGPAGRASE